MHFNFKKIASAASSALMIGSTVALAAAANYPMPFVSGSSADVAIIVGDNASADLTAAAALSADLSTHFAAGGGRTTTTTTTTTGEVFPLFTSSTELYLNDSITAARTTLTDDDLPSVLADEAFSGDVDADYTQTIVLNGVNRILFGSEPTNDDDPTVYLDMGTSAGAGLYNVSVVFDRAVNFTDSDSQGEALTLFGKEWSIGADTTRTELVLYKSSEKVLLSLGGTSPTPSRSVEVDGESYTVELVSGSDTDATVRVTDSSGDSESKEIDEDQSKKVNGVEIAVTSVDESEALGQVTAEITVASDKILLTDGDEVRYGTDEDPIDGTLVDFVNTANTSEITQFVIQVFADDGDVDAIAAGQSFLDPVFGSFKFDFTELSTALDDEDNRETFMVDYSGNDELQIEFTNHQQNTKKFTWYENSSAGGARLAYGNNGDEAINVYEFAQVNESEYVVVGNQDEGFLLKLNSVNNQSSGNGYSDDRVEFVDVFDSSKTFTATITSEGSGTVTIGGKTYTVSYADGTASDDEYARLNYPDSSGNAVVLFPTIETSKGAKLSFVQPTTINFTANSDSHGQSSILTGFVFPDGDDYATTLSFTQASDSTITFSGLSTTTLNSSSVAGIISTTVEVGQLTYNVSRESAGARNNGTLTFRLVAPGSTELTIPSIVIWEEEEDTNDREHALVVVPEGQGVDTDGDGVSTVRATGSMNGVATYTDLDSSDDLSQLLSLYGSLVQIDEAESDQKTATIWYPDDQVQAMIYVAEGEASINGGSPGALGDIVFDASEVSSVSNKNLIVLGGSCINTVAAQLLESTTPICGADFTSRTQVGSGSFLIQSFTSPFNSNKVALLVAGYEAQDTINAANALKSNTVDTMVGKKYTGTTATSLTPIL